MSRWGLTIPLTGVPLTAHKELVEQLPDDLPHPQPVDQPAGQGGHHQVAPAQQAAFALRQ